MSTRAIVGVTQKDGKFLGAWQWSDGGIILASKQVTIGDKTIAKNTAIATILIMITTSILEHFIPAIEIFGVIARIAIIIPFINNLNRYYREKFRIPKNEYEIIKALNEDRENINHFHELKVSLAIDNTSDVIYTKEGQQYLAWTKNGYFHLFLNIIYFNVVYIVVKTQCSEKSVVFD